MILLSELANQLLTCLVRCQFFYHLRVRTYVFEKIFASLSDLTLFNPLIMRALLYRIYFYLSQFCLSWALHNSGLLIMLSELTNQLLTCLGRCPIAYKCWQTGESILQQYSSNIHLYAPTLSEVTIQTLVYLFLLGFFRIRTNFYLASAYIIYESLYSRLLLMSSELAHQLLNMHYRQKLCTGMLRNRWIIPLRSQVKCPTVRPQKQTVPLSDIWPFSKSNKPLHIELFDSFIKPVSQQLLNRWW